MALNTKSGLFGKRERAKARVRAKKEETKDNIIWQPRAVPRGTKRTVMNKK
jgi:hypothetical protein